MLTFEQFDIIHDRIMTLKKPEKGYLNPSIIHVMIDGLNEQETDVFTTASVYLGIIAHFQPFLDGNKRTALTSAAVFLRMNGYKIELPKKKKIINFMVNAKSGEDNLKEIRKALVKWSSNSKSQDFQEALEWFVNKNGDTLSSLEDLNV